MTTKSIKIFFGEEIRRVRCPNPPPSFNEFISLLGELFKEKYHPELLLQYEDEEKDRISVTSQIEWQEALEIMRNLQILTFFISEGTGIFFKDSPPPQVIGFYQQSEDRAPRHNIPPNPCINQLQQGVTSCLSRFFEGGKILPYNIPDWLSSAILINKLNETDVDVDIQIEKLFDCIFNRAMQCLNERKYDESKQLFQSLLLINDSHSSVVYNLACCEALIGNSQQAIIYLRDAIQRCGYKNLQHLQTDPDLISLRTLPEYKEIVSYLQQTQLIEILKEE